MNKCFCWFRTLLPFSLEFSNECMQQKICMALEPEGFLKHSTARPVCCENNSQCYIFDVFLLKSDKCCKVEKVTQLHTCTCQELLSSCYLTREWDDELIKLRVSLTAPLKKSILEVVVEQLLVEKQPPPVKFKTKEMLQKVRRSTELIQGVISKDQWQRHRHGGITNSDCAAAIQQEQTTFQVACYLERGVR